MKSPKGRKQALKMIVIIIKAMFYFCLACLMVGKVHSFSTVQKTPISHSLKRLSSQSLTMKVDVYPYEELLPFLSEHIQPSDQLLVLGANDLTISLSRDGYGCRDISRSFLLCVDPDPEKVESMMQAAKADPICKENLEKGFLKIECHDFSDIKSLDQSTIDSILDAGGLDDLYEKLGEDLVSAAIDQCHKVVRLGNPMVSISQLEPSVYCGFFDLKFGWMQELDGDPEAVSQWFRGKVNIFSGLKKNKGRTAMDSLGLNFYVYTNTDNC